MLNENFGDQDFKCIPRANNPIKALSRPARELAFQYNKMLNESKNKIIFIDHGFISSISKVGIRQNGNLHKELTNVFDIQYHQSIVIGGIKYRNVLSIRVKKSGEKNA